MTKLDAIQIMGPLMLSIYSAGVTAGGDREAGKRIIGGAFLWLFVALIVAVAFAGVTP